MIDHNLQNWPKIGEKVLPAFACSIDKKPLTPNGFKDATTDKAEFITLGKLKEGASFMFGVPTGEISGFDVLDIDPNGKEWAARNVSHILTRTHETRRNGSHYLFLHEPNLKNSASKISPGVDVRATGGYIIWWPSYGLSIHNPTLISAWPDWLLSNLSKTQNAPMHGPPFIAKTAFGDWTPYKKCLEFLAPREGDDDIIEDVITGGPWFGVGSRRFAKTFSREDKYSLQASIRSWREIAATKPGRRNEVLNARAYSLGRLIARGWLSRNNAIRALWRGAEECGLVHDDGPDAVISTIRSGLLAGVENPHNDLGDGD